jgi:hypothetical protein
MRADPPRKPPAFGVARLRLALLLIRLATRLVPSIRITVR